MPVAMHAALEKEADKKGLTGERRDAFIYGTMRKTGWKPKREVDKSSKRERRLSIPTMNTRLDRLIKLNARTNDLVEFKKLWDPETEQWVDDGTGANRAANLAVGAGVLGVGGYAGQRAISNAGGYSTVATNVRNKIAPVVAAARPKIATASTTAATKVASLLSKLKKVRFESREQRLVHLNSRADDVIQFSGASLGRIGAVFAAGIAGGHIGEAVSKKRWDPVTRRWINEQGRSSQVNAPATTGALAGGLGATGIIHGAPAIKRKGQAIGTAVRKSVSRAGKFNLRRVATSAAKAARYA